MIREGFKLSEKHKEKTINIEFLDLRNNEMKVMDN